MGDDKVVKYFRKRIHESWIPVLRPVLPELYATLAMIFNTYPESKDGYRFKKIDGKKVHLLPGSNDVLKAFRSTTAEKCKVIIVGQDPYTTKGLATGLAFAVPKHEKPTPSLSVIFEEIKNTELDLYRNKVMTFEEQRKAFNITSPVIKDSSFIEELIKMQTYKDTSLESWPEQGVLLLNSSLTVEEGKSGSHMQLWDSVVKKIVRCILEFNKDIVVAAFGAKAMEVVGDLVIDYWLLKTYHPAYDARSGKDYFVGSMIFRDINKVLEKLGKTEIKW